MSLLSCPRGEFLTFLFLLKSPRRHPLIHSSSNRTGSFCCVCALLYQIFLASYQPDVNVEVKVHFYICWMKDLKIEVVFWK